MQNKCCFLNIHTSFTINERKWHRTTACEVLVEDSDADCGAGKLRCISYGCWVTDKCTARQGNITSYHMRLGTVGHVLEAKGEDLIRRLWWDDMRAETFNLSTHGLRYVLNGQSNLWVAEFTLTWSWILGESVPEDARCRWSVMATCCHRWFVVSVFIRWSGYPAMYVSFHQ